MICDPKDLSLQLQAWGESIFGPIFREIYGMTENRVTYLTEGSDPSLNAALDRALDQTKEHSIERYMEEQQAKEDAEIKRVNLAFFDKFIADHMALKSGLRNFLKLSTGLALSSVRPDPGPPKQYRDTMIAAVIAVGRIEFA